MSVAERYHRFFRLGGLPTGRHDPWHFRRECTSMRLKACVHLVQTILNRNALRILDLGSGITSHMIRSLMPRHALTVYTTDLSKRWLDTTVAELVRDKLDIANCMEQTTFDNLRVEPFDVVCVDLGNMDYRVERAPDIARWTANGGIILLDDFGMRDYAERMTSALNAQGFAVAPVWETLDEYDTYMAQAVRS